MRRVLTEDIPEIVQTLNEVVDILDKQEEEKRYKDYIPELTYSASTEDIIDTLNNILRHIQGDE